MATRVSDAEVRQIIRVAESTTLDPFITMANVLTDRVSSQDSDSLLSAAALAGIERNLAAHFCEAFERQYSEKKTLDAVAVFQGQTGMFLESTKHGQNAIMLDFTGYLARLNANAKDGMGRKVKMHWGGKPPSSQTDYVDRD